MGGQRHAPATLPPPGTHYSGGWVSTKASLDGCRNSHPTRIQSLDHLGAPSIYRIVIETKHSGMSSVTTWCTQRPKITTVILLNEESGFLRCDSMSLGDRVLTFQRHMVPLYLRVKGQVDEEVTLDDERTTFLYNFRTAALQRHIAEDCTPNYTSVW